MNENKQKAALEKTILEQRRLLALLQDISLSVNQARSEQMVYSHVLRLISQFMNWPLAHVYACHDEEKTLESTQIWYSAEQETYGEFKQKTNTLIYKLGEGRPGKVWQEKIPHVDLDLESNSGNDRDKIFYEQGFRAYFAFPVLVQQEVTAVLEFFSLEPNLLTSGITALIEFATVQAGMAISRLRNEANIRLNEARLAEAQHLANLGHWEWHINQDSVVWSDEIYRIFGVTADTFEKSFLGFLSHVHPDDRAFVQAKIRDAYENNSPFNYFHRIVRPDGTERVVLARGRPIKNEQGKTIKLTGTVQDMTVQKEAELKLAQTVRKLTILMEIGQAIAASLDLNVIYKRVLTLIRPLLNAETILLLLHDGVDSLHVAAFEQVGTTDFYDFKIKDSFGVSSEVYQTGRSILRSGKDCYQSLAPELLRLSSYKPHSVLSSPIQIKHQVIGVITMFHPQSGMFDHEAVRLLETVAAFTSIAIANAQQYYLLRRRIDEQELLDTISSALTETLETDQLLQLIVESVNKIIPHIQWCSIHLLNQEKEILELVASAGIKFSSDGYTLDAEEGIGAQVLKEGVVVNIPDMQQDPRQQPIDRLYNSRSFLVAPIESRITRLGIISVQCNRPNAFGKEDERLLTILGVQAGMALENAQLFSSQREAKEIAEVRQEQMRQLANRVVTAQEEERARIARELHDESGQSLTSLKISLDLIKMGLPEELSGVRHELNGLLSLIDQIMKNLRLLSHNLRPPGLDHYGIDAALSGLCQDFAAHTGLNIKYNGLEIKNISDLAALSLYRFVQEALTNAAKHARAANVVVTLTKDSDMILLTVEDDGCGFIPQPMDEVTPNQGAGLLGMVERLEMVSGRLEINSQIGEGSQLTAVVPILENTK